MLDFLMDWGLQELSRPWYIFLRSPKNIVDRLIKQTKIFTLLRILTDHTRPRVHVQRRRKRRRLQHIDGVGPTL